MSTSNNRFRMLKQKIASDSTSWGSLLLLALGVTILVLVMVLFSY